MLINTIINVLSELSIISELALNNNGILQFKIAQRLGQSYLCEQGILIAITLSNSERSMYWVRRSCILLAAYEYGIDDAIQLYEKNWYLWHRYPLTLSSIILEQGLCVQLALACLLEQQPNELQVRDRMTKCIEKPVTEPWV